MAPLTSRSCVRQLLVSISHPRILRSYSVQTARKTVTAEDGNDRLANKQLFSKEEKKLAKAEQKQRNSYSLKEQVKILVDQKLFEKAEMMLKRSVDIGADSVHGWNLLIKHYANLGNLAQCDRLYQQVTIACIHSHELRC
jgi:hypothetical protein